MKTKKCTKCKQIKILNDFAKNRRTKSGLSSHCKKCKIIYALISQEKNKVQRKKYMKEYIKYNKNRLKKLQQERYRKNRIQILKQAKKYYENNKKEIMRKTKLKRKNNPSLRLRHVLSNRIHKIITRGDNSILTMQLLDCSIEFFKQHLEKQFKPGMSWNNYGKWHIDHIIPCARFNLSNPEEQKKCFHYTNLRPLWAEENLRKGSKIIG